MTSFFAVNPSNERLSNHAQRSSWPRPPPPELRATRLGVTAELDANHVLHKCHPANAPPERRCEPGLARPGAAERGLHPGAAQPGAQRPGKARPSLCAIRMCRTASRRGSPDPEPVSETLLRGEALQRAFPCRRLQAKGGGDVPASPNTAVRDSLYLGQSFDLFVSALAPEPTVSQAV